MSDKITLLYVDDEPTNLMLFEHNFRKSFEVLTAESGLEGLEILKKNSNIRAVITDMRMPEMDGVEFIKRARKDFPQISYFILSGFDISDEIIEALNQNIILKYFKKPFNKQEIEEYIAKSLN